MKPAEPPAVLDGLETLTLPETLRTLHDLAALVPEHEAIVEIGTYRGASACWLAAGAQAGLGARVWTVDPHDLPGHRTTTGRGKNGLNFSAKEIREHAATQIAACGLADRITMIRDFSVDAAAAWVGPPIGLLFIDGDHRQGMARRDMRAWQPRLSPEAVIAWDDYADSHPGVSAAVAGLVNRRIITAPDVRGRLAITALIPPRERALGEAAR